MDVDLKVVKTYARMVGVKLAGMKDVIEMVGAVLDGIIVVYEQSEKRLGKASSEFDAWKEKIWIC